MEQKVRLIPCQAVMTLADMDKYSLVWVRDTPVWVQDSLGYSSHSDGSGNWYLFLLYIEEIDTGRSGHLS